MMLEIGIYSLLPAIPQYLLLLHKKKYLKILKVLVLRTRKNPQLQSACTGWLAGAGAAGIYLKDPAADPLGEVSKYSGAQAWQGRPLDYNRSTAVQWGHWK